MENEKELDKFENIEDIKDEDLTDEQLTSSFSGEVLDAAKAYLLSIKQFKLLSDKETISLFKNYRRTHSKKIKNTLTEHNLRLVIKMVNQYGKVSSSVEFLDLVQEGNIGLMKAIDKYDITLGYKFSTYATYWIRQAISRSRDDTETTIRIPANLRQLFYKYLRFKNDYRKQYGELPSEQVVKEELGLKGKQYAAFIHIENNIVNSASLNSLVSDDSDANELGDFVADKKSDAYNDSINKINDYALMHNLKEGLPKLYYYILYYRVLIEEPLTLETVGKKIGLTRERVRQIETKALAKANSIRKKARSDIKNYKEEDILPEPFEKYAILTILKTYLKPHEYYIFYHKWYLKEDIFYTFSYETATDADIIYNNIMKKYAKLFLLEDDYNEALKEVLGDKNIRTIFESDISPLEYSKMYFLLNRIDKSALFKMPSIQDLENDRKVSDFFDTSIKTIHPSQVESALKTLNIRHYGYEYKKISLSLDKLYQTYLDNINDFTEQVQELLNGTLFSSITKKRYEKHDDKMSGKIDYNVSRLEAMYYNIDNYFKYELSEEQLKQVLHNKKNDLSDEARKLLKERYLDGKSIQNLASEYGVTYIKMHDDLRTYNDHAINLYLKRTNRLIITDEERYKEYILNKKYPLKDMPRKVCYLFFIEHKTYHEIASILHIENTYKVSNFLTESIRKMDMWYYGITHEYVFPDDKVMEALNSKPHMNIVRKIIINRFIKCIPNEETALEVDLDVHKVSNYISSFIEYYNEYHSRVPLTIEDIINEVDYSLCDSVLTEEEKNELIIHFNLRGTNNIPNFEDKVPYPNKDQFINGALTKIREHKCGLLFPNFSVYSSEEIATFLKDPLLPISDYEKDLLRDYKGLNGVFYNQNQLAQKYDVLPGSIFRRINRALLAIKKYEAGEIDVKIDFKIHVVPLLKYFPLFDQQILTMRFRDKYTYKKIGKLYNLSREASMDLIDRVEKRFYYLLKCPNAKKFDFDYANSVIRNDDLPFYGNKDLAIKLYERQFGDDGEYPQTRYDLMNEFNLTKNTATSRYIKDLMCSVMKYKDGYRKNKSFSKEEIEEFYSRNKDKYSRSDQLEFERFIKKLSFEDVLLPQHDAYNDFVTYELLKEKEGTLFYNQNTNISKIKEVLLNNPYNLSHAKLELLRNFFKITKRELMSGKDKTKLLKLLYPALVEYDIQSQNVKKRAISDERALANKIHKERIVVKEDVDNNIKNIMPYLLFKPTDDVSKILVASTDLDYVFSYIFNHVKDIDVLKRTELLEKLYELKKYILTESDRNMYKEIFKDGLTMQNLNKLKYLPVGLKAFFMELIRLKNSSMKQDIKEKDTVYIRKTLLSNEYYFQKVGIRCRDTAVNFIDSLTDYYREINLGKINPSDNNLTEKDIEMYLDYLIEDGTLISYLDSAYEGIIDELFSNVSHEVFDIRGYDSKKSPVGKLIRVKKS